ncbi:MAG TPA: zinc-ribbon domain-containing protein, partial [Actinomycetota bacterium]|nr:zinc-ribbon domain-containing protein [Actinomycetota bacterium]
MTCPRCGTGNPPGARFCRSCGTTLADARDPPAEAPPGGAVPAAGAPAAPGADAPGAAPAWASELRAALPRGWTPAP